MPRQTGAASIRLHMSSWARRGAEAALLQVARQLCQPCLLLAAWHHAHPVWPIKLLHGRPWPRLALPRLSCHAEGNFLETGEGDCCQPGGKAPCLLPALPLGLCASPIFICILQRLWLALDVRVVACTNCLALQPNRQGQLSCCVLCAARPAQLSWRNKIGTPGHS